MSIFSKYSYSIILYFYHHLILLHTSVDACNCFHIDFQYIQFIDMIDLCMFVHVHATLYNFKDQRTTFRNQFLPSMWIRD